MPDQIPEWDLSDLYQKITDPQITKDQETLTGLVKRFEKKYRYTSSSIFSLKVLIQSLKDYEVIIEKINILGSYAGLLKAKDTISPKISAFEQKIEEFSHELSAKLAFFELQLNNLPEDQFKTLIKNSELQGYKHFLVQLRKFKPYLLSEKEEMIMTKKSQSSSNAFIRLYDETISSLKFPLKVAGKMHNLSYSEITPYLSSHPDRKLRKAAAMSISKVLAQNTKLYSYILNTLAFDKKIDDQIRSYQFLEQATYLSYKVDAEVVDNMTQTIIQNQQIVEQFYLHKSKLVGHELHEWDRYSSIIGASEKHYTWQQAKQIILNTFEKFSPEFAQIAKLFFDKNWIDAKVTKGKVSGAFCSYVTPNKHPYILTNFTGKMRDISILAHELGHGIHAYLSREQSVLNFWPSTAIAEIASVFCEMLVFDHLYNSESDKLAKAAILSDKIQDIFATIFRQNAFFVFEKQIKHLRATRGELTNTQISQLFQKSLQQMFGKGLVLSDGHKNWWIPVAHFFHYNFYVFTYCFGETLTNSLFEIYRESNHSFAQSYISALRLGGSKSPQQLTKLMGVDIRAKNFWKNAMQLIQRYVIEFVNLT